MQLHTDSPDLWTTYWSESIDFIWNLKTGPWPNPTLLTIVYSLIMQPIYNWIYWFWYKVNTYPTGKAMIPQYHHIHITIHCYHIDGWLTSFHLRILIQSSASCCELAYRKKVLYWVMILGWEGRSNTNRSIVFIVSFPILLHPWDYYMGTQHLRNEGLYSRLNYAATTSGNISITQGFHKALSSSQCRFANLKQCCFPWESSARTSTTSVRFIVFSGTFS